VVPAIKPAAEQSQTKAIAVLGTPGTVKRRYVDKLISDFASDCQVVLHGSTELVEFAEQKLSGIRPDQSLLKAAIAPIFESRTATAIDTIILACTHFPLLRKELYEAAPRDLKWIDSGNAIARRTQSILQTSRQSESPSYPQTAFLIARGDNPNRIDVFKSYGFSKTVTLMT